MGVDGGHTVRTVGTDDGEVSHTDVLAWALLDQAHPGHAALITGKAAPNAVEEAAVDLVDDFELAREHDLEPRYWPPFQGLGQQGVIRVGQGPLGKIPGLVPRQVPLIEQNPHQLGDGQRGVRVVELDGDFLGERAAIAVAAPKAAHEICEGTGDEKVFLYEAQALAHARGIVGIENPGYGFGRQPLGHRADELAMAEDLKVEVIRGGGRPEAKGVDGLATVAHHRAVERDADQRGRPAGHHLQAPAAHLEGAVQLDLYLLVRTDDFPGIGPPKPVVRLLVLPAVLDGLLEDAVLVPQPVAHGRKLHGSHRVYEARS